MYTCMYMYMCGVHVWSTCTYMYMCMLFYQNERELGSANSCHNMYMLVYMYVAITCMCYLIILYREVY